MSVYSGPLLSNDPAGSLGIIGKGTASAVPQKFANDRALAPEVRFPGRSKVK